MGETSTGRRIASTPPLPKPDLLRRAPADRLLIILLTVICADQVIANNMNKIFITLVFLISFSSVSNSNAFEWPWEKTARIEREKIEKERVETTKRVEREKTEKEKKENAGKNKKVLKAIENINSEIRTAYENISEAVCVSMYININEMNGPLLYFSEDMKSGRELRAAPYAEATNKVSLLLSEKSKLLNKLILDENEKKILKRKEKIKELRMEYELMRLAYNSSIYKYNEAVNNYNKPWAGGPPSLLGSEVRLRRALYQSLEQEVEKLKTKIEDKESELQ